MKKNALTAALLALMILMISFSACKKEPVVPDNTSPYVTEDSSSVFAPTSFTGETTTAAAETTTEEEDDFEFSAEDAQKLGDMNSEIYGRLSVYYQDLHIAVLDEYDSVLFSFPSQDFAPPKPTEGEDEEDENEDTFISEDMNFDGYSDIRILYRTTSLNKYYLCWLWDMTEKGFVFYEPLATIPTPSFETNARTVVSLNKSTRISATLTTYKWQDDELLPIEHKIISTEDETLAGSDDIDTAVSITDGLTISYVMLSTGRYSNSRWMCKIENENIVKLLSDTFNENELTQKFAFIGSTPGTTTVVFRYTKDWDSDYVAEKVVNITVNADKSLTIVEIA